MCWSCGKKGHYRDQCRQDTRGSSNVVEPYLEEHDGAWAIAELSDDEDDFFNLWTKPVVSLNDGGDFDSPVYHFPPAAWLSDNEDEANEPPGRIFERAVDLFALDTPLGEPHIEKAWMRVNAELCNATNEVARGAGNVVSQRTDTTEHEDTQDLPLDEPLLTMSTDIMMSPDVAHVVLGPDKSLLMGETSPDMARGMPECFEMDRIEVVGMMEWWEMWNERDKSLIRSKGECEGEVVGGTCTTHASACGQHDELKDELTHLVYP